MWPVVLNSGQGKERINTHTVASLKTSFEKKQKKTKKYKLRFCKNDVKELLGLHLLLVTVN